MLKYCMRMQGIGFFVAAVLCGLGCYLFFNHNQFHASHSGMNEYSASNSVVIQNMKLQESYSRTTAYNLKELLL